MLDSQSIGLALMHMASLAALCCKLILCNGSLSRRCCNSTGLLSQCPVLGPPDSASIVAELRQATLCMQDLWCRAFQGSMPKSRSRVAQTGCSLPHLGLLSVAQRP